MHLGILTSGGDCAGLNAAIRGVVRRAVVAYGDRVTGFREGWRGLLEDLAMELTIDNTRGLLHQGGTVLKSSRKNPYKVEGGVEAVRKTLAKHGIDVLLVVGGDGSLRLSHRLSKEGVHLLCLPKTIDNDVPLTDYSFGFDTALGVVVDALDRLATTAESHDRIIVCEVMGNESGWLAFQGGLAGGADYIFIPEVPADLEGCVEVIRRRHERGRDFSVVVAAVGTSFPTGISDFPPPPFGPDP
ncbi:MAG: ATP-dependent 6-phosphofructokinase, partial [Bdellovibrionota bacterium]